MKIALVDSGIGLLAAAAAVRRMRPDADLVLSCDPEGMPWGPRTAQDVSDRALRCALAAAERRPDALIVACNTASVHALTAVRTALEPALPVVGTVPAIKPAAAGGGAVAIWATPATTGSAYQRALIAEFGGGAEVTEVPCPGLADAVQAGDTAAVAAAIATAAALTPTGVRAVVLGCTHYELVTDRIAAAVPGAALFGSADAVAAQALRRIAGTAHSPDAVSAGHGGLGSALDSGVAGGLEVLLNGRAAALPDVATAYAEGAALAVTPATA